MNWGKILRVVQKIVRIIRKTNKVTDDVCTVIQCEEPRK